MARFHGHFAGAYGTFSFVLLGAAIISGTHIDAGAFGLTGIPIFAAVYARARVAGESRRRRRSATCRGTPGR